MISPCKGYVDALVLEDISEQMSACARINLRWRVGVFIAFDWIEFEEIANRETEAIEENDQAENGCSVDDHLGIMATIERTQTQKRSRQPLHISVRVQLTLLREFLEYTESVVPELLCACRNRRFVSRPS